LDKEEEKMRDEENMLKEERWKEEKKLKEERWQGTRMIQQQKLSLEREQEQKIMFCDVKPWMHIRRPTCWQCGHKLQHKRWLPSIARSMLLVMLVEVMPTEQPNRYVLC
jgi:hypothetical protein